MDLLKDEFVQEKVEEAAKLFYTNDTVTINLYWAAAAALLFFLREWLLCPLFVCNLSLCSADPSVGPPVPARSLHWWRLRGPVNRLRR